MPYGVTKTPSSFERFMENVLRELQWVECLHDKNDTIVPASTIQEELLVRLENVFKRFLDADLKLKHQSV